MDTDLPTAFRVLERRVRVGRVDGLDGRYAGALAGCAPCLYWAVA